MMKINNAPLLTSSAAISSSWGSCGSDLDCDDQEACVALSGPTSCDHQSNVATCGYLRIPGASASVPTQHLRESPSQNDRDDEWTPRPAHKDVFSPESKRPTSFPVPPVHHRPLSAP